MKKFLLKENKGQSIIEFALLLPILLLVVFGITEFGRAIMTKDVLHTASREGARLAAVSSPADSLDIRDRVIQVLSAANITPKDIIISFSTDDRTVWVTATTDFEVLSGGVLDPFVGTFTLTGKTVMRYER
jgi:Flp pilus assembly protein TadG